MKNKSASKSSSSSKSKSSGNASFAPGVVNDKTTLEVRKIENGFVISERGYKGKGRNQEWVNKEYFSKVNPVSVAGAGKIKFGGK